MCTGWLFTGVSEELGTQSKLTEYNLVLPSIFDTPREEQFITIPYNRKDRMLTINKIFV